MFTIRMVGTDRQELYKKIKGEYPEIELDGTSIKMKNPKTVLDVIHFLGNQQNPDGIEFEVSDLLRSFPVSKQKDYFLVRRYFLGQYDKKIGDETTIFDNKLSIDEKRILLKKVDEGSKFYKSYEKYLWEIAIDFARKITGKTVTLDQIVHEYTISTDIQSKVPTDAYPTKSVDLRLYPLEIQDLERITELINEIKQK